MKVRCFHRWAGGRRKRMSEERKGALDGRHRYKKKKRRMERKKTHL